MKTIKFEYKNHRGEIAIRTLSDPILLFDVYPPTGDHCWCIRGVCLDRKAYRTFRCSDIIKFEGDQ